MMFSWRGIINTGLDYRLRVLHFLPVVMEGILLLIVGLSPWAYGAVHPGFEFLLFAGASLLAGLWGLRILLEGRFSWKICPVTVCLALLFLFGIWQLTPLDKSFLATISPTTAGLYQQLLPAKPEIPPLEGTGVETAVGTTLSLYPQVTRLRLQRILAVFLIFVVVRNNLGGSRPLRRLAIVAVANGALLSLFALVQFFSSPPTWVYWTYPSMGSVFGPFICRNHFPFYINMCIGLGLGLLWSRRSSRLLHDPVSLQICLALALMLSSVAFSLSRGGFLALVGGFGLCVLVKIKQSSQYLRPGAALLTLALVVGVLGWFGIAQIQARLSTLWGGSSILESRMPLWVQSLSIIKDFPLWGSGYGTYQFVNPLYPVEVKLADQTFEHVHNDYLEMLVEGGIIGFLLNLLAIGLVFRLSFRALAVHKGHGAGGLALGALFGFTTVVIQSFVDFGIHIPAITLLAAVLAAQLCPGQSQDRTLARCPGPCSNRSAPIQRPLGRAGGHPRNQFLRASRPDYLREGMGLLQNQQLRLGSLSSRADDGARYLASQEELSGGSRPPHAGG